ncbi:hypothetical protein C8T65DRAFT_21299 [Cerioporus squamosus]|nr:hypothetical protein C8T65DRAFT_21299 [Cerioporus squamosus]
MHQPTPPHALPLLTYEAYCRAQLEHMANMANATPTGASNPPSHANIAPYPFGGMLPVKVHIEYTLPLGQNMNVGQLPFAAPFPVPAPIHSYVGPCNVVQVQPSLTLRFGSIFPSVPTVSQGPASVANARNRAAPTPGTADTDSGRSTSNESLSASFGQPAGQQPPAPRPERSSLVLPRPAALREAMERMRQVPASQAPQDRPRNADDSESTQVDEQPRPDASVPQAAPAAPSASLLTVGSETAQTPVFAANSTAPFRTAEPAVKTEPQIAAPMVRKKALHPERHRYKIRGTKRYARWYSTKSALPIPAPPDWLRPTHGFLYVHRHRRGAQVWMYYAPDRVRRGEGPSSTGRAPLRLVSTGIQEEEGRWVKARRGWRTRGWRGMCYS